MKSDNKNSFRLGEWRVYPLRNILDGPPGEIHIEPRAMQVLERLAANAGEVVEREDLLDALWGGRATSDEPLTRCISTLRRVLDDSASDPRFIQTIPKRGYRLICGVDPLTESADADRPVSSRLRPVLTGIGTALFFVVVSVLAWQYVTRESPRLSVDGTIVRDAATNSVAVLPFVNLGPDAGNQYLADGLADELSNQLTKVAGLRIAARTSSFAFKGKNTDITEIARQLRVTHVLTGSVRQDEDRLRISAQLTEASSGFHVWSETWDRRFADVFDIQDEIAGAVVTALRAQLLSEVPASSRTNPEAYDYYLRSREAYFAKREPSVDEEQPQLENALSQVTHSLALDPDYAPAWSTLAWIHFQRGQWTKGDPGDIFALAEAAARRALSIDPQNASAMSVIGAINDLWYWDSIAAAEWYSRALAVVPESPGLLSSIQILFMRHGASESWLDVAQAAFDNDPLNVGRLINLSLVYWDMGLRDAARGQLELARQLEPDAARIQVFEAMFAYLEGDFETAETLAGPVNPMIRFCALHALGRDTEAGQLLREIRDGLPETTLALARVYACIGDADQAFAWLRDAQEQRHPLMRTIRTDRFLKNLHSDPRWDGFVSEVGVGDEKLPQIRAFFRDFPPVQDAARSAGK